MVMIRRRQLSTPQIQPGGFTLIELLVVIGILGILAAVVYASFGAAQAQSRDVDRQNALRQVEIALENFRRDQGRYPVAGCDVTAVDNVFEASQNDCDQYIGGLPDGTQSFVPAYIPELPVDPRAPDGEGFVYITNSDGTVFKFMARSSVEAEIVGLGHPLQSCDLRDLAANTIRAAGWCRFADGGDLPSQCDPQGDRFQTSYAVWGGFAAEIDVGVTANNNSAEAQLTTAVICR